MTLEQSFIYALVISLGFYAGKCVVDTTVAHLNRWITNRAQRKLREQLAIAVKKQQDDLRTAMVKAQADGMTHHGLVVFDANLAGKA